MKKIFLYLTLLFSGASMAQLEKNTLFVGSFISPENQKFFNSYYYSYLGRTFTPSIGFMLSNKWALGTEFNFGFAFRESQQIYKNFYFSAFSRYYFINEKKFAMYVNLSSGYSLFHLFKFY